MKKCYQAIITGILLFIFIGDAFGQHQLVTDAKKKALHSFSLQKNALYTSSHQQALAQAAIHGWKIRTKTKDGGVKSLQGLNSKGFPIYLKTYDNIISAATTQTNAVQPGGSLGLNLSGSSSFLNNKLAIWDGGAVYAAHQEFTGKTITINSTEPVMDHSTHVAGTMIAKGVYAPAKGMAFNANTLQSYDFDNDITTISAAASGLILSNHSYGDVAGWDLDNNGNWTWYGLPGDSVDYAFGQYSDRTVSFDQIEYNAPYYLIVESAGNSRGYNGPAIGGTYQGYTSATNMTLITKTRTATSNISSQFGYDGIATTGNAKNILTVGSVGQLPYGPSASSDIIASYFSSYGPTDDGRVKPDVVGMGENVLSCGSASPTTYITLSGTSMSAPNVTGSLYLLQEYYGEKHSGAFMRAATLKGLVCATAVDAGNVGPDYMYGWGLLNTKAAAQALIDNGTKSIIKEDSLSQGQTKTVTVTASGDGSLIATIAWTDPAGTATTDGIVNDRTIKLVNDLDVRVSDGTATFMPWILDPLNPSSPAQKGDNIRDNVEQVYIAGAVPGRQYTITVSHKNTLRSGGQAYSLITTGVGGSAYCTSGPTSSADSRINNVTLSNINNTPPAGCTTYSDYTNLTDSLIAGKTYPLSLTLGTCGNSFNKVAKVYIDWNGDGNFNGPGELVATTNVINGTGSYNTNITVPITVVPGNYSRMRVVLMETSDTSIVQACGTYAKGETQDYRVEFIKSTTDAGAVTITSPDTTGNCSGPTPITITLKNFGSAAISNIPVTVTVQAPDNSITTFNETYTGTLSPLAEANFTLNSTFNATAGATYNITAVTRLPNDVITSNDTAITKITINPAPIISNLNVNYCIESRKYSFTGTGDGTIFWYNNTTDAAPIAIGSPATATQIPANKTVYAGINDFSGTVGPPTKEVFSGGGYNQYGPSVLVHANAPVTLQSARLYIGYPGNITFSVTNSGGETLSSTTINVAATTSNPQPGAQDDDPSDTGKVYNLNLQIPAAGDYSINVAYDDNVTIYRNNAGVSGYPFSADSVFTITGNTATGTGTNPATYYYYFYNLKIKSLGCTSDGRQAATLVRPTITQNGTVLSSNFALGNEWYQNGSLISNATGQTYSPPANGNYKVRVTSSTGCSDTSFTYVYISPSTITDNGVGLTVYPVPANTILNVLFDAPTSADMSLSLVSSIGRIVYTGKRSIAAGNFSTVLNVSNQAPGVYILKLMLGTKAYTKKIVIVR
ncbi:MAG: S8 family serine peptidase [Sphingobacteriales bacterium]